MRQWLELLAAAELVVFLPPSCQWKSFWLSRSRPRRTSSLLNFFFLLCGCNWLSKFFRYTHDVRLLVCLLYSFYCDMLQPVFPLSCPRAHRLQRLRTRINLLRTDIFLHRHIFVRRKITIVRQAINFSDTNTARFWVKIFFFFFWSSSYFRHKNHFFYENRFGFRTQKNQSEFPKKVRNCQNFCAQRAQKIRGNVSCSWYFAF